jgi:Kef-type K+ transport system membrane component KefB
MPSAFAALFPPQTLPSLNTLSQVGLVLFMFLVGLRLRSHALGTRRRVAIVLSGASIVMPFALGTLLASAVHYRLAPSGVGLLPFALFIGAAMSITAFPVLARILLEHGLLTTELGTLAITCAAFGDVTGWLMLAGILTLVHAGTPQGFVGRIVLFFGYLAVMAFIVRPSLRRLARWPAFSSAVSGVRVGVLLLVVLASAVATDALGVHALFGAFFAGLMMPAGADLERSVTQHVEPVTMTLLPLFFAFTGLRTNVQLIDNSALWRDAALFLAVAVVGKGVASAIAARAMGIAWREAAALGVLLNTRGLIELVVLNVGLELGIVSPLVYSMLVLMALVTTFMASPLMTALVRRPCATIQRV